MGFVIALIIAVLAAGWLKSQGVKRSSDNAVAGVCAGIARRFGWDITVVRVLTFILAFGWGFCVWAYIVAWVILDEE